VVSVKFYIIAKTNNMNKDENEKFDVIVGEPKEEVELGKDF